MAVVVLNAAGTHNWTVPADFNPSANTIELIGGGGGGAGSSANGVAKYNGGGGGGSYRKLVNANLTPGSVVSYTVGAGGASNAGGVGNAGGTTSFAGLVSAAGGAGGNKYINDSTPGGAGGSGGSGGSVAYNGGAASPNAFNSGGGGAAGPYGNGGQGTTTSAGPGLRSGGQGDAGHGGLGGVTNGSPNNGAPGNNGTEMNGGVGAGGGGAGSNLHAFSGTGGLYGGGGAGGYAGATNQVGGAGARGVIVITYTPIPPPTITKITPANGVLAGNTPVTITGTNFNILTSVKFDGVAATNVVKVSSTTITCKTPAHVAGVVNCTVVTSAGSASKSFTYVNAIGTPPTVAPAKGTTAGGTWVKLTGVGFTGVSAVSFGGVAAVIFNFVSDTVIWAQTPAGSVGPVDVAITIPSGTIIGSGIFTYAPTLARKTILLTSTALTTWQVPADWNPNDNAVHCIGAGASGVSRHGNASIAVNAAGGGAGAYSRKANLALTPGATLPVRIGTGGASPVLTGASNTGLSGNPGGATWFNGSALSSAACSADGGLGNVATAGGLGGKFANSIGDFGRDGGDGGSSTAASGVAACGGGGAGGPNAAGAAAASTATANSRTDGGTSDGTVPGGASISNSTTPAGTGASGSQWTSTVGGSTAGSGAGGGAAITGVDTASIKGGDGGAGGGGGGGACYWPASSSTVTGGKGGDGLIVISYVPIPITTRFRSYILG
ncbi:IPT/TIG domain-containing protein [Hyphomicrobium sp. DY-1]|uniref:IPT/TIG domain-containing protein n=1 Tax=Hyphomicrobium sp. DY-1 TaxID=3075650 RepID=UPI0039C0ADB3